VSFEEAIKDANTNEFEKEKRGKPFIIIFQMKVETCPLIN